MKLQNPDAKTLEETSGSTGFFSFSQDSDGMASDFEVQAPESTGGLGLKCADPDEAIGNNAGENIPANEGSSRDDDTVSKIEVSGENLSLVVDFSGSLTGVSCRNAFDSSGSNLTVNVKKENGGGGGGGGGDQHLRFMVGDIVWVLTKYRTWWPGEVVDFRADEKESLLVRYFEQSHVFLWRSPSQIRPFNQNIENMLKQSQGKSFTRAVEKVMTLLGDSVRLEMTCPCTYRETLRSAEENGKPQRLKPSSLREFSIDRMIPGDFVAQLKNAAKCSSVSGLLELTVMQSRLSAFYSFLGHKKIPMDQLCEKAGNKSPVPTKLKPKKRVLEGSMKRNGPAGKSKELSSSPGMEIQVSGPGNNVGAIDVEFQNSYGSRERKRSKYLSYPFVDSKATNGEKVLENDNRFIGSPSTVAGSSRKRFQREWFRKFLSEEGNASFRGELANASLSDLISELRLLAMNYQYSKETDSFCLNEWFFSKFRMSVFHDERIYEKQIKNKLVLVNESVPDAGHKTSTSKREDPAPKSKIEPPRSLSDVNLVPGTQGFCTNNSQVQTPSDKAPEADAPDTLVPDLNSGSTTSNFVETDRSSRRLNTSAFPEVSGQGGEKARSLMLNFQVTGPCATDNITGAGFVFVQPGSDMSLNLLNTDLSAHYTNPAQKKRQWKRKRREEPPLAPQTAVGIPDLNGTAPDSTSPLPQEKTVQRRRRRKKEELPNGETKGTTVLHMKFTPGVSMPSKDDLTSTFSGFGPLDATETRVLNDSGTAQVAFVSCGDAIEAVKSLEKTNPFGETLVSFRLQQRPATAGKNVAPRLPVISVSPASRPCEPPPMSVDMIRQNLMMMTSMLERSGDTLSEEMRVKLKSEITGLLEKVSSMPSSSSS